MAARGGEAGPVADNREVLAVVAHKLLNDLAAIQGLLATARLRIDPTTPELDGADHLLGLAELRAVSVVAALRRYAWGLDPEDAPLHLAEEIR